MSRSWKSPSGALLATTILAAGLSFVPRAATAQDGRIIDNDKTSNGDIYHSETLPDGRGISVVTHRDGSKDTTISGADGKLLIQFHTDAPTTGGASATAGGAGTGGTGTSPGGTAPVGSGGTGQGGGAGSGTAAGGVAPVGSGGTAQAGGAGSGTPSGGVAPVGSGGTGTAAGGAPSGGATPPAPGNAGGTQTANTGPNGGIAPQPANPAGGTSATNQGTSPNGSNPPAPANNGGTQTANSGQSGGTPPANPPAGNSNQGAGTPGDSIFDPMLDQLIREVMEKLDKQFEEDMKKLEEKKKQAAANPDGQTTAATIPSGGEVTGPGAGAAPRADTGSHEYIGTLEGLGALINSTNNREEDRQRAAASAANPPMAPQMLNPNDGRGVQSVEGGLGGPGAGTITFGPGSTGGTTSNQPAPTAGSNPPAPTAGSNPPAPGNTSASNQGAPYRGFDQLGRALGILDSFGESAAAEQKLEQAEKNRMEKAKAAEEFQKALQDVHAKDSQSAKGDAPQNIEKATPSAGLATEPNKNAKAAAGDAQSRNTAARAVLVEPNAGNVNTSRETLSKPNSPTRTKAAVFETQKSSPSSETRQTSFAKPTVAATKPAFAIKPAAMTASKPVVASKPLTLNAPHSGASVTTQQQRKGAAALAVH